MLFVNEVCSFLLTTFLFIDEFNEHLRAGAEGGGGGSPGSPTCFQYTIHIRSMRPRSRPDTAAPYEIRHPNSTRANTSCKPGIL